MKKFLLRITNGLYKKVKDYADENGISAAAAIRTILSQFFKNKV